MKIEVCETGVFQVNSLIVPITKKYAFVTDPGGHIDKLAALLDKKGLIPLAVVLTHGHFDHILGLSDFCKKYPRSIVAIHKKEEDRLGKNGLDLLKRDLIKFGLEQILHSSLELPSANIILEEGDTLSKLIDYEDKANLNSIFGNASTEEINEIKNQLRQWDILSTPGHTPGSICLYNFEQSVLISGDTLFYLNYGRTDLEGGDDKEMKKSLSRLYALPPTTLVYPGHDIAGFPLAKNL